MLIDLAARATKILKVTIALVGDIHPRAINTGRQVCTLDVKGVLSCRSLDLAKLSTRRARKLEEGEDHLSKMTELTVTLDALIRQIEPPFTERVMRVRVSSKFKLPSQLGMYEGKTDPVDHLESYKNLMMLQEYSDEMMCKAFLEPLKGPVFKQKNASHLFAIHQDRKSLKDYVRHFNQAILEVKDPSNKVVVMAMMKGLCPGSLFYSLSQSVPKTLSALQIKDYIIAEELAESKWMRQGKDDHKRKESNTRRTNYGGELKSKRFERDARGRINERHPCTPPR
ncbi:hypothetical protein Acr_00g0074120 [Actinidia rufa]|uniref:Retrotransposon gag domain-containing protein n=1 Tax=Actinidia rufa TaxID=165716 RepID=A0A7J0DTL7_9ERIC|nr:hypothetical protein Acr_00g0074120 [Actinidia rufa]